MPKDEAKRLLIAELGAECWGRGWEAPAAFPSGGRAPAPCDVVIRRSLDSRFRGNDGV